MNAPSENANARRQPGERASNLINKANLATGTGHVNADPGQAELRLAKALHALREFAKSVTRAGSVFGTSRGVGTSGIGAWLVFYEAKQAAYSELMTAVPAVAAIPDFWRYVQNMPVAQWLPIIEAEVQHISASRSLCEQCETAEVSWPTRTCPGCQQARRRETYRSSKQRTRIEKQMRKCPRCGVALLGPRQRVCLRCQADRRQNRNQRYQKSLKERNLRRVQSDYTKEENSTLSATRISDRPAGNVDARTVLPVASSTTAGIGDPQAASQLDSSALEVTR